MSIPSKIDRIKQNVAATYTALEEAGATMPTEETSANLAATAATLALTAAKIIAALGYTPANANLFPVATANIADSAVTRAKLATDALISPIVNIAPTHTVVRANAEQTLRTSNGSTDYVINVNKDSNIPAGFVVEVLRGYAKTCKIVCASNVRVGFRGETGWLNGKTFSIPTLFSVNALQKVASDASYDYWQFTNDMEVV